MSVALSQSVTLALNLFATALALGVVVVVIVNYARAKKNDEWATLPWWRRLVHVARDSMVWLVGYAQVVASAILTNTDSLLNAIGQPQIVTILDKYFDPKMVGYVLLASAMWFMWARGRTLTKSTMGEAP